MLDLSAATGSRLREVIAAWLVCLATAAGCYILLSAAAVGQSGRSEALIGAEPTVTVAAADADRAGDHRHGRC